jgi:hypothetical protein
MGHGVNGNLVDFRDMDPEKAFEIRSKGGKACAEAQRKRKELKETLIELLAMGNTQEELCAKLIAGEFNPSVFAVIRDTVGEKPVDVQKNLFEGVSEVEFKVKNAKKD